MQGTSLRSAALAEAADGTVMNFTLARPGDYGQGSQEGLRAGATMALASQSTMAAIRLGDATLKAGALSPRVAPKGPDAATPGGSCSAVLCSAGC